MRQAGGEGAAVVIAVLLDDAEEEGGRGVPLLRGVQAPQSALDGIHRHPPNGLPGPVRAGYPRIAGSCTPSPDRSRRRARRVSGKANQSPANRQRMQTVITTDGRPWST